MTDDLPAGPAPEPALRPHGQDELRTLAAPRRLSVDDHMFTAPEVCMPSSLGLTR